MTAGIEISFKMLNFVIFLTLLLVFTRKPAQNLWIQRRKLISDAISAATGAYDNAKAEESRWAARFNCLKEEAAAIMENLKSEGEFERKRMLEQANLYAYRLLKDARAFSGHETERAIEEIKRRTVDKAIEMAAGRLLKELSTEKGEALAERASREMEAG